MGDILNVEVDGCGMYYRVPTEFCGCVLNGHVEVDGCIMS